MSVAGFHASWRWGLLVVRGLVAIAAGIAGFAISPQAGKVMLAAYFAADGLLALGFAVRLHGLRGLRLLMAADGVVDLVVAVLLFAYVPNERLLILIVSLWAIATGVLEFIAAVFVARIPALSWGIALIGIASCAVGIFLVDRTDLAEIGLLYFFAAYALIAGVLFVTAGVVLARAFRAAPPATTEDGAAS
ncbi:MAG TPA: hypothetical protein VK669_03710 [Candidatus Limnocylindrales bacterium]|nr:hypothetical protein [Candidatus Limnocylindrales bacterium]